MHAFLSFNEAHGGNRFQIPGYAEQEPDDVIEALREPMPLKSVWAMWEQVATGGYATRKVVTFSTAQEFWSVWSGIPQPSELLDSKRLTREQANQPPAAIDAIMIFRDGISPEWEDAANMQGGHFQIQLKPTSGPGQIDEYWNNLVLGVIGEALDSSASVTGVRLVDKLSGKGKVTDAIRLEMWYHSSTTNHEVAQLKRSMEKCLTTRIDGSQGPILKGDAIQDKKHSDIRK
eukprot:TRINITY_DN46745_c0_g1_i1.p1 TRINITY_DN46745_c0_g1~~TRINITY_DN46745_c0_g1_i1.p1  ORF type:complete len:232 (-),score=42.31 TRINITY_DN46745_c0_g1_i1:212-907(-)